MKLSDLKTISQADIVLYAIKWLDEGVRVNRGYIRENPSSVGNSVREARIEVLNEQIAELESYSNSLKK